MLGRARFEPVPHPIPDARILDVLKLGADRVGINALRAAAIISRSVILLVIQKKLGGDLEIEILLAETEFAQREKWIFRSLVGQRIEPRDGVSERAISVNQAVDPRLERTLSRTCDRGCGNPLTAPLRCGRLPSSKPSKKARPTAVHRFGISCQRR